MRGVRITLALVPLLLLLSAPVAGSADARAPVRATPPVASLEPAKTARLWKRLVRTRRVSAASAECRPLRAVFYAATDWLRLATELAAAASPCADYHVSIPPLVADKTQMRPDQAWRIRALGPRFHALAEIHYTAWSRWVADTGSSWYAAGVTARQRMAAAGFDVAQGDSWAVNEVSSAVRRGDGSARANIRELVRGLYEGDGSRPTRGAAFVIGFGQATSDVSVYQNSVQHWLADSPFWTDMSAYVSDWSQEVYGDLRRHAVAGAPNATRREYLNDYLQHKLVLASAGPAEVEPARSYLRDAHSPLANAAWQYDQAYGWTAVPAEQMAAYVSAQVNALRHFSATSGQARDHWGFAWAPKNAANVPATDFAAQTGLVLDRMAAAIRDSGEVVNPADPGSGACGPPGQDALCLGDVPGAAHTEAWRSFRSWASSLVRFTTPARALAAGGSTDAVGLALVTGTGARVTSPTARVVSLRSSSPTGTFAPSPAGPWTPTLTVTVPAEADGVAHYRDTRAGAHTLTASAPGSLGAAQTVTVSAGPVARVALTPASGSVRARGTLSLSAGATDAFGNAVDGPLSWRVQPAKLAKISGAAGGRATLVAARVVGKGAVVASAGSASATATVVVRPGRLRVASLAHRRTRSGARVTLRALDAARRPVSRAVVVAVVRGDGPARRVQAVTGRAGRAQLRLRFDGCVTLRIGKASAAGFRWDGRAQRRRMCS